MNFEDLERNLNNIDIEKLTIEAAMKHTAEMVDLNTGQLNKGLFSDGSKTPEYASKPYADYKKQIGKGAGQPNMNFNLEGDFHAGFFVKEINKKAIEFGSKDGKAAMLEQREGENLFGLTEESKGELAEMIIADGYLQESILKDLTK